MIYRKKSEMMYRMIFLRAWAKFLPVQTQSVRELQIQISKLDRLCSVDELEFFCRFDSLTRAKKMKARHDHRINSEYKTILSYVERVFQDVAICKNEGPLTRARLQERVYGAGDFIPKAESYAKQNVWS
jgi:hypothetical protein